LLFRLPEPAVIGPSQEDASAVIKYSWFVLGKISATHVLEDVA